MRGKTIIGMAVVLTAIPVAPSGICAATAPGRATAYPCCPKSAPMPDNCGDQGCTKAKLVIPLVPLSGDRASLMGVLPDGPAVGPTFAGTDLVGCPPLVGVRRHRFLSFHELLINDGSAGAVAVDRR